MISSVRNHFEIYYQKLPNNIAEAALISAVFSFGISALITGRIEAGKTSAVVAATVSLVSALTAPIFSQIFANRKRNMDEVIFGARLLANLGITHLLINSWTSYRVNLISHSILTVLISLLYTHYYGHDVRHSQTVILSPVI